MKDTITVKVTATITAEYRQDIAGFGDHLAHNGQVLALPEAQRQAKGFFRAHHDPVWKSVTFWVTLDDSGLAYRVSIHRGGSHRVEAAAPLPGADNVKDIYVA